MRKIIFTLLFLLSYSCVEDNDILGEPCEITESAKSLVKCGHQGIYICFDGQWKLARKCDCKEDLFSFLGYYPYCSDVAFACDAADPAEGDWEQCCDWWADDDNGEYGLDFLCLYRGGGAGACCSLCSDYDDYYYSEYYCTTNYPDFN